MTTQHVDVPLRWLDDAAPAGLPAGATLGVPLPRGAVPAPEGLAVIDDDGAPVPAQTWPLATWPDGSVKWAGIGLGSTAAPAAAYRVVAAGEQGSAARPAPASPDPAAEPATVRVEPGGEEIVVHTGPLRVVVPRSGTALVGAVHVDERLVATGAHLVSARQDHPEPAHRDRTHAVGHHTEVEVEQGGPVRAVLTLRGRHRDEAGPGEQRRAWLPFTVRLYFTAGARTFRMVHTFTYDGDPEQDFLAALGVRFSVPLRAACHDRHVRFVGAQQGVLREAVQGLTGLRRDPGEQVRQAQVQGRPTPDMQEWQRDVGNLLTWVPRWPDYTLRQLGPQGYSIAKRTAADRPWIDVAHGDRAAGFAYLGDNDGGLGVGLTDFWQSHPTGIDLRGADTDSGEMTVWLWSPDADPMDLRFYHDGLGQETYPQQLEALEITYEDYEPGLGSAHGIARTHELDIVAYPATPDLTTLTADAAHAGQRPRLVPTPQALARAGVFGDWDVADRSSPARAELEDRLTAIVDFYLTQVEERSWYGFWNYGDVMHSYDFDRHTWKYDVGGYAWDNSELATDLWLWSMFLRTGRADVFRMAEAMARHTGDVDVYHCGKHRGLGTRHNVQHWGCSAKQVRIGSPAFRRPHYFLTADEHSRDLLLDKADSDAALAVLEPTRKLHGDDDAAPLDRNRLRVGLGTDWGALAATWLANWEIAGDVAARDRLLGTMADIGAFPNGFLHAEAFYDLDTGRFTGPAREVAVSHLSAIFGLVEICSELIDLVQVPGFEQAWLQYCRLYLADAAEQVAEVGQELTGNNFPQWHSRLLAYAAHRLGEESMADRAWAAYRSGGEHTPMDLGPVRTISPPEVLTEVSEVFISTNDAAQSSLAAIQNLALIGHRLDAGHGLTA
ncbi:Tat pathway signal sequence domain protein [Pseudactinotalea sp. Z1748]|uniref:exo-rhamnogalacturonan lyase family protein n=1 Tax=Pseudactinotalea sp. Z1748 TaxID=3413027 RepID=UPI003C79EBBC